MNKIEKLYSSIKVSPRHGERKWIVVEDIQYTFKSFWEPFTVYIHKGFEFDWASIPKIFHIFATPMWTDTLPWALFHDFLYRKQYTTREQADQCFNELMLFTKVKDSKRKYFYIWVRIWGWKAWNKNNIKK